jgi:hypothetical protein
MATKKFTDLPAASSVAGSDILATVNLSGPTSQKATATQVVDGGLTAAGGSDGDVLALVSGDRAYVAPSTLAIAVGTAGLVQLSAGGGVFTSSSGLSVNTGTGVTTSSTGNGTVNIGSNAGVVDCLNIDGTTFAQLAKAGTAGTFGDGTRTVLLADGTNHVSYTATTLADWAGGVAPTDVWVALDRIAAALTAAGFPP